MHPTVHAQRNPNKAACIMARSGVALSYRQLDELSNQFAHALRREGMRTGDTIALLLENHEQFLPLVWAAQRAGLIYVCLATTLSAQDLLYILQDSGARLVIVSSRTAPLLQQAKPKVAGVLCCELGPSAHGNEDFERMRAAMPIRPVDDESAGNDLLYSSGTTGRPKGVRRELPSQTRIDEPPAMIRVAQDVYGFGPATVYLAPAPLYHAGPLRWAMAVHRLGGTVIVMDKFDAEWALELIERHRITAAQWVPTHFIRMLRLPADVRKRYDLSSMRTAFHAAAPCPVHVKEAMLEWWGAVIHEYYGGTEGNGLTMIGPQEWLTHRGSVGRAVVGNLHICDESGEPVSPRQEGTVYFSGGESFEYLNDPGKTVASRNSRGWSTLGDIGWLDEEGYLYLTDRKHFMIISGGVNIYPQEIENVLIQHPQIADVAVIGAPDDEMGERVVAVVELMESAAPGSALAQQIMEFARSRLGGVKAPKQVDFTARLPREATGKLYKRALRDAYRMQIRGGA